MLSLIGALIGFGSSFLPKVLGFFEAKRDQRHELEMMDKQLKFQSQMGEVRAQAVETGALHQEHAQITTKASQWCINLAASVRPIITYCLFLEFAGLTLAVSFGWINMFEYEMIWNRELQAVWAAVVAFWFGSRTFSKK